MTPLVNKQSAKRVLGNNTHFASTVNPARLLSREVQSAKDVLYKWLYSFIHRENIGFLCSSLHDKIEPGKYVIYKFQVNI